MDWRATVVMGLRYGGLVRDSVYQWLWGCSMMDWGTTVVMGLRYDGLVCDSGYGTAIWWTGVKQWLWGCDMMDWGIRWSWYTTVTLIFGQLHDSLVWILL
jgi:hypothetical protein